MFLGPVFWMEIRNRARRLSYYFARFLFVAALFFVISLVYFEGHSSAHRHSIQELAALGELIFSAYSMPQFVLVLLFAPIYCGGAIADDRQRRVLDLVFTSQLTNVEVIAGKFLVRMFDLCSLVVGGIPIFFLFLLLGGVAWRAILVTILLTLTMIAFVASLSLFVSIGSRRVITAVTVTYLILLIAWLGLPMVGGTYASGGTFPWLVVMIFRLNPLMGLAVEVFPNIGVPPWGRGLVPCVVVYGSMATLLMVLNVMTVRRLGLWASRPQVVRDRKKDRVRKSRQVWANPVAWREVMTLAIHRRMRWPRIFALLFMVMFSCPIWVAWLADFLEGRRALSSDIHVLTFTVTCTAVVAWFLMAVQASVSFAYERDHGTLDAILTTPMTASFIVLGKLAGVYRSLAFAVLFPLAFIVYAYTSSVVSWRAAVLASVVLFITGFAAAAWGMVCSVRAGSSTKASGWALGVLLVLFVGVPLLMQLLLRRPDQYDWLPLTLVSPSLNISYAIFENADYSYPYGGISELYTWMGLLILSCVHLTFALVLAFVFTIYSIIWVERSYRSGGKLQAHPPVRTAV